MSEKLILEYKEKLNGGEEGKLCKYYAEYEGICCHGDCPECADICTYSDEQEKCEFYEKEREYDT